MYHSVTLKNLVNYSSSYIFLLYIIMITIYIIISCCSSQVGLETAGWTSMWHPVHQTEILKCKWFFFNNLYSNFVSRCVKERMVGSMPTCCVQWTWRSSLGEPSLTWRALTRRSGYWRLGSTPTVLSSWLWAFTNHTYPSGYHRYMTSHQHL